MRRYQQHSIAALLIFLSIFVPQYVTEPRVVAFLSIHPWMQDLIACVLSTLSAMGVYGSPHQPEGPAKE